LEENTIKKLLHKLEITDRTSFFTFTKQFLKFGFVGISNTLIALTVYYILIYRGVYYIAASVIAFVVSVCNAYFWNSRYVFSKKDDGAKSFAKTFLAYGSTGLLSIALAFCMVDILHISQWVAPLINLCITIPLNFLLNKFWAFR